MAWISRIIPGPWVARAKPERLALGIRSKEMGQVYFLSIHFS
jgi:hypothetical protein